MVNANPNSGELRSGAHVASPIALLVIAVLVGLLSRKQTTHTNTLQAHHHASAAHRVHKAAK